MTRFGDVTVTIGDDFVAEVEMHRPPDNFFDADLIRDIATAYELLDGDPTCRAIVLCSEGKNFCAGAQLAPPGAAAPPPSNADELYSQAKRLFLTKKPV